MSIYKAQHADDYNLSVYLALEFIGTYCSTDMWRNAVNMVKGLSANLGKYYAVTFWSRFPA